MLRISMLALLAAACGGGATEVRKDGLEELAGWWIETAETLNQNDVGNAYPWGPAVVVVVQPSGGLKMVSVATRPAGPKVWIAKMESKDDEATFRREGDLLHGTMGAHRIELRRATRDESRRLDATVASQPPASDGRETPPPPPPPPG